LAGALIGTDQETLLAQEWREAVWADAGIKAAYPSARDLTVETALTAKADAETLAARLGGLFGQARRTYLVSVEMTPARLSYAVGADCLALDYPPLGLSGLYRLVGRRLLDPARNMMTFRLWG